MNPTVDIYIYEDGGIDMVGFVINDATVIEYKDILVPGIAFSPIKALEVARILIEKASEILKDA